MRAQLSDGHSSWLTDRVYVVIKKKTWRPNFPAEVAVSFFTLNVTKKLKYVGATVKDTNGFKMMIMSTHVRMMRVNDLMYEVIQRGASTHTFQNR